MSCSGPVIAHASTILFCSRVAYNHSHVKQDCIFVFALQDNTWCCLSPRSVEQAVAKSEGRIFRHREDPSVGGQTGDLAGHLKPTNKCTKATPSAPDSPDHVPRLAHKHAFTLWAGMQLRRRHALVRGLLHHSRELLVKLHWELQVALACDASFRRDMCMFLVLYDGVGFAADWRS